MNPQTNENREKTFVYKDGRIYFTKRTERLFFFVLTLVMLGWGVCLKLAIF